MKKVFALALSLMLAAPALTMAQAPAAAPAMEKKGGAVMTAEDMKFEFGSVKQGAIVEHTFNFKNTGTEPLVISNVGVSCGCTTPEYTKDPVMPGKTGKITARFNTSGKLGQQNKVLTVSSNNAGGNVELALTGTVTEATTAAPMAAVQPSTTMEAQATPVAKGKIKVKKADGKKDKVKMTAEKVEVKK